MSENGYRSMAMSESIQNLAAALIEAQTSLPKVPKDKTNPFFKSNYAGLDSVMPAALKVLTDHGLGLVQSVGQDGNGNTTLTTVLLHKSGEWYADTQPLLLVKADPQSQGSAITYARRYAVMSVLGLVAEEDDDGNRASPPQRARPAGQQRPTPAGAPVGAQLQKINETQIKAIRASLSEVFAKDERAQCEWMATVMPTALNEAQTEIHLSPLTHNEAASVLMALNQKRAERSITSSAEKQRRPEAAQPAPGEAGGQ